MVSRRNTVVLVNTNRMRPVVAPIGLDYLGTSLREHGYRVALLDLAVEDDASGSVEDRVRETDPLAVGVTIRNTDDCYFASRDFFLPEIKRIVDSVKRSSNVPIVLGGCAFSIMPVPVLEYCRCELGVRGDGEIAFVRLLDALRQGADFTRVPGLIYRTKEGWHINPHAYAPVDRLPLQKRATVNSARYFTEGGMGNIETKRGCDRRCIYCADPVAKGRVVRTRIPQSVAEEIERLLDDGVDVLHTCDSEFNLPIDHATAVCDEIIRRKLGSKVRWYAYMAPKPFTEPFVSLLKRAGCAGINFGVDSGNDTMLQVLGRDFTVQDVVDAARLCRAYNITFMFDLLIGGPGETERTAADTINLMRRVEPDRVGTAIGIRVYPETALARIVQSEGSHDQNRNLHGAVSDNPHFLKPIFYLSADLGEDPIRLVSELVGNDERFFIPVPDTGQTNYNYNDNEILVEAIKNGYRGAFWDILRRLPRA